MMNSNFSRVRLCIALIILHAACSKKPPEISWDFSDADVISPSEHNDNSRIDIDIYLDATLSMLGYASTSYSVYTRFLDELEIATAGSWKSANVKFFKFGTKILAIDREGFKAAKTESFYREPGVFEETNIDSVINRTDSRRVTVVLTDLFQDEGDVNSIVLQIREKCFAQGIQVAILAVPSDFDGTVFDARVAPYRYRSTQGEENTYRPFYALMFGAEHNLRRMFGFLQTAEYVDPAYFLMISRHVIEKFEATVTKARKSRSLNMRTVQSPRRYSRHFGFSLKDGETTGTFEAAVRLERSSHAADFQARTLELIAYRKSSLPGTATIVQDSIPTNDLRLASLQRTGDSLAATIDLELAEPRGIYSYLVFLQLPQHGGFELPGWIESFSSPNPTAKNDSQKTLNLKKFVIDLMRASQSLAPTKIAKFYVTVYKR